MSSFGFSRPTATDFRHPSQGLGFSAAPDPFASISQNRGSGQDDDDAIDFDDTYDGLGDGLEEADDDFNDDTFGGEEVSKPVGKDFDFFGSTSKVTNAINEEAVRFNRHQPPSKPTIGHSSPPKDAAKPFRSGYEAYQNPTYRPDIHADASIWGTGAPTSSNSKYEPVQQGSQLPSTGGAAAKKMMSLEEVEAAMRAQSKKPSAVPQKTSQAFPPTEPPQTLQFRPQAAAPPPQHPYMPQVQSMYPPQQRQQYDQVPPPQHPGQSQMRIQPRPAPQSSHHASRSSQILQADLPARTSPALQAPQAVAPAQILQRGHNQSQIPDVHSSQPPRQILQNPHRQVAPSGPGQPGPSMPPQLQPRGPLPGQNGVQVPLPVIYHPSQIMQLTEEERNAYLIEEAKRAKRNHKIFLLSKGNGLMSPQDKNFITRIQLQQLMTATGNATEQDSDAALSEDFYYQVYNQIENRPRQNPHQPLSNFAQTYLFRTGGRQNMGRRQRGGDSHVHRMEQQVQRAVEAAKAKPKNKQLVIEGSLGKISFSNAKTPKPLLNIKRHDSSDVTSRLSSKKAPQAALSTTDRKAILKNIEAVYSMLMDMEDHDRRPPPQPIDESDESAVQAVAKWQQTFQNLNQKLWMNLKVTEPIMSESVTLHPFIAFLSYPKGKKAIPRVFNHIDDQQRLTVLTMIMVHLDILDVVRLTQPQQTATQPPSVAREQIDLFLQAVIPSLFSYVTEAQLNIVIGLLGLIVERVNVHAVARTRVGLEVLTMLLSRAAIVKATEAPDDQTWEQWLAIYNRFFDLVEPLLGDIFPTSVNAGQDQYVWQFLAATGSGANPEQQQRLVLAVKDRVMDTLQQSKTLPPEMASQRRGNVNLFMQAIGLDVDLLDG